MTTRALLLVVATIAACGRRADVTPDGSAIGVFDVPPPTGPFTLTSSSLSEGGTFAIANTCDGANESPALAWINAPLATQSFAVVLTDRANDLLQWVIFDVPASHPMLPAGVQKAYSPSKPPGAHQTPSFQASVRGYLGPCPPQAQGAHSYELAVYAIDVVSLPGASSTTTRFQAIEKIMLHSLGTAKLTGLYER